MYMYAMHVYVRDLQTNVLDIHMPVRNIHTCVCGVHTRVEEFHMYMYVQTSEVTWQMRLLVK